MIPSSLYPTSKLAARISLMRIRSVDTLIDRPRVSLSDITQHHTRNEMHLLGVSMAKSSQGNVKQHYLQVPASSP